MKHESCKNCKYSRFDLKRDFGILWRNERWIIRCSEIHKDLEFEEYALICNLGCKSFKDNNCGERGEER